MDSPGVSTHIYTTGAVYMRNQVQMALNKMFSNFVVDRDRYINPPEDEYDEYDRIHGVSIDIKHRVVSFYGSEYEDRWENAYGLSGRTGGERLFDAMDIILNRWRPKNGSVAGYDDDDAGIIFTKKFFP